MKKSLNYLPENKQQVIEEIQRVILNSVEQHVEFATGKKQYNRVVWIVLFGSYARGDYVEDPINGYISDIDVLVVMNRADIINEYGLWSSIEGKIDRRIRAPLTLIVHTQREVTQWLQEGHYFFSDIQRDGIYLFSYSGKALPEPKLLGNLERLPVAQKHFDQWFESAGEFFIDFGNAFSRNNFKLAAFYLHQATERYYSTLLLVLSNYRPKTHDVKRLRQMAIDVSVPDTHITTTFINTTRFNRRCFELLKRAYVDARYSEYYTITEEELTWLSAEVMRLEKTVEQQCLLHMKMLKDTEN